MTPGTVVEGTVVGITNFGAFVQIEGAGTGLVHISEIANEYVRDVNNHVKMNEKVKVKVLNVDSTNGKMDLSLKQAAVPDGPAGMSAPVLPRSYRRGGTGADIPAGPSGTAACFNERSIFPLVESTFRTLTLTFSFIFTWLLTSRTYSFAISEI